MKRNPHASGAVSLAAVALAASALTVGAFFSVSQAGCPSPGDYVRQGNQIALVGGCVSSDDLPAQHHVLSRQQAHQPAGNVPARP
jgi:hypothetical protein